MNKEYRFSEEEVKDRNKSKDYIYVLVRLDLSLEQQLVQACHASACAGESFGGSKNSMVLLGVNNKEDLIEIAESFSLKNLEYELFFEPDWDTGYSALATAPIKGKNRWRVKNILKNKGVELWKS